MAYEIVHFPRGGAIDVDAHVLEPEWLWRELSVIKIRPPSLFGVSRG